MNRSKVSITLPIKGRDWEFILLSDKVFDKMHNEDDGSRAGITMPNQYQCHFRKSDWSLKDIRHELGHALYHMCLTSSSDLTPEQVEETMCQIIGEHTPEIMMWCDRISEKFFGRD
jgi:hypothetical protein